MIKEAKLSLQENLKERISSPILGSYILFFLGFHWKIWVILFWTDLNGIEKINKLSDIWPNSAYDFLAPAFYTVLFLFSYPFAKLFYEFFIKTVEFVQIKYEQLLVRNDVALEEMKLRRELERKRVREKLLAKSDHKTPEDINYLISILKISVENNYVTDEQRETVQEIFSI